MAPAKLKKVLRLSRASCLNGPFRPPSRIRNEPPRTGAGHWRARRVRGPRKVRTRAPYGRFSDMRRPNTLLRAIRAMTAVITLWCLGCSGFEPLLGAAFGLDSSVMTCASDGGSMGASMAPSSNGSTGHATVSAAVDAHHGFDCGCGSCHSASPSTLAIQSIPQSAPTTASARIGELLSVVRAPLLPPPQRTA